MDYQALRDALQMQDNTVTIDATLSPTVRDLLATCYHDQPVTIANAQPGPGDGVDQHVIIAGTSSVLNLMDVPVLATFSVDGQGDVQADIRYTLLGEVPEPNAWKFSRSFPQLPTAYYNVKTTPIGQASALLDNLELFDAAVIVTTSPHQESHYGVSLERGMNFVSQLKPTSIPGFFATIIDKTQMLTLYGTINIPNDTDVTLPLQPFQYPWDLDQPVPGIHLKAELDLKLPVNKMGLHDVLCHIYSPTSTDWLSQNETFEPVVGYAGTCTIPSAHVDVQMLAVMQPDDSGALFRGDFQGVSVDKLAALLDIAGTGDLGANLPEQMKTLGEALGKLEIINAAIYLSLDDRGLNVSSTYVTVGMPDLKWHVWDDHFDIDRIACTFAVQNPFRSPSVSVHVMGTVEIEGVPVNVFASTAEGFTVYATLAEQQTLPLNQLMQTYVPEVPPPGDLTINSLQVGIAPWQSYTMAMTLAQAPNAWELEVGPETLTVSDASFVFSSPKGGAVSGAFGATVALGDVAKLSVRYDIPGNVVLRAICPEIKLSQLVLTLCNQHVALPSEFDLDFENSAVMMQKSGQNYVFQLATTMKDLGTVAFEARRVSSAQNTWGFSAGIDLTGMRLSALPGLKALQPFEELFSLDELLVVAASFADPAFTFPSLAAFNSPSLRTGDLKLPAQAGGLIEGLNLYARWTLHTDSREQQLLRKLLGLDPSLGVTLQVGAGPAADSRLYVSCATKIKGLPFTCQFGGQLRNGQVGLFLTGTLEAKIQGRLATFDVTTLFVANGAFISGSMLGSLTFGHLTLSNLAVVLGVDWEGVPSFGIAATLTVDHFQSSLAIFFDSADPARSLLAGAISKLSLKDVLDTFAGDVVPSEVDAVLDKVALKGTGPFTIDAALATALDNLQVDKISAAFGAKGIKLPTSAAQVLLNVSQPGKTWFLTDMTTMMHYELTKTTAASILVTRHPQFYFAPEKTSIGDLQFNAGMFITAALQILSFTAQAQVLVQPAQGIAVEGSMDRIVIGTEALFSIESRDGTHGPVLSVATFKQPTLSDPALQGPHFLIDGSLNLLGLTRTVYVSLNAKDGFAFDLKGDLVPGFSYDLNGHFNGLTNLGVGGSLTIHIGVIDLGPLGKTRVNTGVTGAFNAGVTGTKLWAHFTGGCEFAGDKLTLPQVDLDVNTKSLPALPQKLAGVVTEALKDLLKDAAKWLQRVRSGVITEVSDVGRVLRTYYDVSAQEAAKLLKGAGYAVNEVGTALRTAYDVTADQAASILKGAGYAVNEIGDTLRGVYGATAQQVATLLKGVGYAVHEVGGYIKDAFHLDPKPLQDVLQKAGFAGNEIKGLFEDLGDTFKDAFDKVDKTVDKTLHKIGGLFH